MHDWVVNIIPTKIQAVTGAIIGVTGTMIASIFGEITPQFEALVAMVLIDYLTGVLAAYINVNSALDSEVGLKGICKKAEIFLIVAMCHYIDYATGQNLFCTCIVWSFIGNEGISIIENAGKAGLPIPAAIKQTLEKLKDGGKG